MPRSDSRSLVKKKNKWHFQSSICLCSSTAGPKIWGYVLIIICKQTEKRFLKYAAFLLLIFLT